MRPLTLKVSGLTCFRDEVVLDFAPLNLVAIAGPTGAGKSTLLDAMILALYGFVPRMGSKNLAELISHGRSGLSVVFDFRVGAKVYRIARAIYRGKRASQALLSELVEDGGAALKETRIASGVKEVQEHLRDLMGIDGEAFTQAVILPQGRFQDFLKATPGDRRKIMIELLGLEVYDLMRVKASEIAVKRGAEVEVLESQLSDLGEVDAEIIAQREAARGHVVAARDEALVRQRTLRERLAEADILKTLISRRSRYQAELDGLESQSRSMDELRARVARLTRVLPIAPQLEAGEALRVKLAQAGRVVEGSAKVVDEKRRALAAAEDEHTQAAAAAGGVAVLRARIAQLDEVKGQVEALSQARAAHQSALAERAKVAELLAQAERRLVDGGHSSARQRAEVEVLKGALAAADYPRAELEVLVGRRDRVLALGLLWRELERRRSELEAARSALVEAEDALALAETDRRKKEVAEVLTAESLQEAMAALEAWRRAEAAGSLRAHLHAGEACPVCQQEVVVVPEAMAATSSMVELTDEVERHKKNAQKAQAVAERARRQEEGDKTRHALAVAGVATLDAELRRREAAIEAEVSDLELGRVEPGVGLAGLPTRLEAFERRLAELSAAAQRWQAQAVAVASAERTLAELEATRERQALEVGHAQQRLGDMDKHVGDLEARVVALAEKVADIADPLAERRNLERSIATLEATHERARVQLGKSQAEMAAAEATHGAHQQAVDALAVELSRLESDLVVKLAALSLSLDEARELAEEADPAKLAEDSRRVDVFDAALARARTEWMAIDTELAGRTLAEDEVARLGRELTEATSVWEGALGSLATLDAELTRMKQQVERANVLRVALDEAREAHRVYKRLGEDLKSNQFQEYVLEEVNADLAAGASERLLTLSGGRYRLGSGKDGYEVFDEEYAGERRSTDTLSGGETFLASLALALELSEQIQGKSGRVHLDCIFIDEGFGTLDAETLETVAEAVEALGASGRLVGLITHVTELAQRMPDRIQVEKSNEGSRLRVITG